MNEDEILVLKLNLSDKGAFSAIYEKYIGMVYSFAFSILNDQDKAKDISQTCFVKLWENREKILPKGNLPAYLYITARNSVYKETKRMAALANYLEYKAVTSNAYTSADNGRFDFCLIREKEAEALASLPIARKRIYLMKTVEGMSTKEIASRLGISVKTVETQIERAKRTFKLKFSELL